MFSSDPDWLQEIDHTGDIGIQVTAESLPQLFERAATGTFHVLTDLSGVRPAEETTLRVHGRDREALLVRWLSELNYRHTVENRLFCDFDVQSIEVVDGEFVIDAVARGEPIDPERHVVHTEIKAITFHGLEIQQTDDEWAVQVIFDM